jgi:hypothetical protein
MQTVMLRVDDSVYDKFQWLISHFSKNEISVIDQIEMVSDEEQKDIENILNSMTDEDKEVSHSEILTINI